MGLFKINGVIRRTQSYILEGIRQQLDLVNLKAVKNIVASYDPFHDRHYETRSFICHLHFEKLTKKYPSCKITTEIKCDRSEPTVAFDLVTGGRVLFKSGNLSTLEMLQLYNIHVTPHAPAEQVVRETLATKAMKKSKK